MIKDILWQWEIDCVPVKIYHSVWEIEGKYVLKEYDTLEIVEKNIAIFSALYQEQIPVPIIISTREGQKFLKYNNKYYMMTTKLEGKNIDNPNEYDVEWFFGFGVILAKLHMAFLECEKSVDCWNNSLLGEMKGWVSDNLKKYNLDYLSDEDINNSIQELESVYEKLPKQLIHRDVHLGNFLFDKGKFSGYIDFDLSQRNIRIFDLCYFLLGLLLEEDNNRVDDEAWYQIIKWVICGYNSKIKLCEEEKGAIVCVMKNIELLFIAYFLGSSDEKSAQESAELFKFVLKNENRIKDATKT